MSARNINDLIDKGQRLLAAGDRVGAHSFFALATTTDPRHEQAWLLRAKASDDPQEAAECLEQALALNPKNSAAHQDLTYSRVGKLRPGPRSSSEEPKFLDSRLGQVLLFSTAAVMTVVVAGVLVVLLLRSRVDDRQVGVSPLPTATQVAMNEPAQSSVVTAGSPATNTMTPSGTPESSEQAAQYSYVVQSEIAHASCSGWVVSGHVRGKNGDAVNGVSVRAMAADSAGVASAVSGNTPAVENAGYWEFVFPAGSDVQGKIELIGSGGQVISAAAPFHLTATCSGNEAANWIEIEFRAQ